MKRLLVIFTGGTIASAFDGQGKAPVSKASQRLKESLNEVLKDKHIETVIRQPLGEPGIDSSEMSPGHWMLLSRCIAEELQKGLSGVLILHGTDTMADTAAWMSLCFGNLPIPVILTGSQLTLDYMAEDVTANLRGAAMACCSELRGVWVYFNWKLIPGDRAHKGHSMHPDAFEAVNGQPLFFNSEWALDSTPIALHSATSGDLHDDLTALYTVTPERLNTLTEKIRWVFARPGMKPCLDRRTAFLCILGYGAGNMIPGVLDGIEDYYREDVKPVIIACSQAEEGIKHPDAYDGVGMARLADAGFPVWSQTDRTSEFVHALCCYALMVSPSNPGTILGRYLKPCRGMNKSEI